MAEIVIRAVDGVSKTLDQIGRKLYATNAPIAKLEKAFAGLYKAAGMASIGNKLGNLQSAAASLATTATVMGGAGVGAGFGLYRLVDGAMEAADNLGDLGKKMDVAPQSLQVLGEFAAANGSSLEGVSSALTRLGKNAAEAANGNKGLQEAFAGVGLSTKELKSMKPDEIMMKLADAFKNAGEGAEKNKIALAMELMGKSGADMIPMLNEGSGAIAELKARMLADGALISDSAIKAADDWEASRNRLGQIFKGVRTEALATLSDGLRPVMDALSKVLAANQTKLPQIFANIGKAASVVGQKLTAWLSNPAVFDGVARFFEKLPTYATEAMRVLGVLAAAMSTVGSVAVWLADTIGVNGLGFGLLAMKALPVLTSAISLVSLMGLKVAMLAPMFGPIGLAVAGVAAVALVLYKNWDDVVLALSTLWKDFTALITDSAPWKLLTGAVKIGGDMFKSLGNIVMPEPKAASTNAVQQVVQAQRDNRTKVDGEVVFRVIGNGRVESLKQKGDVPFTGVDPGYSGAM